MILKEEKFCLNNRGREEYLASEIQEKLYTSKAYYIAAIGI